ncbi:MoxR family ATPase [bacterium]|nr:MoxR family ATPase [bacterium]
MTEQTALIVEKLALNMAKVIIGKPEIIELTIVGLLARGHILIEDVPGVGKTTLARVLAKSIDSDFRRIQFTPDLLPSDILGVSIYNTKEDSFNFKQGPIFANVILADEINRATPRTQSSLLEAMNDFQVTVDGKTYELGKPFIVLATQNPIEYEGTYTLPESQMDRFLLRITIGYPSREDEIYLLKTQKDKQPIDEIGSVISAEEVVKLQDEVKKVHVDDSLTDYILKIVQKSREDERLYVGVSPRGGLFLLRAAQALALVKRRDYVTPDDIKILSVPVLAHRIIERSILDSEGVKSSEEIISSILDSINVPV